MRRTGRRSVAFLVSGIVVIYAVPALAENPSQTEKIAAAYSEEEVTYENAQDHIKLAGTLTLPKTPGLHPAVLLITGSGPQNRNEAIGPLKPFLVLADSLARRGIAVLRVDDRGVGGSTGNWLQTSHEAACRDVVAGLRYLKGRKEIAQDRIGLVGHSEGGVIGAKVAAGSSDVAFLVLLAAPAVPGQEIIFHQNRYVLRNQSEEQRNREMEGVKRIYEVLKNEKDPKKAEKTLREFCGSKTPKPIEQEIRSEVEMLMSPWSRDYWTDNPRPSLQQLRCPVLALYGEKDVLVPSPMNLDSLEKCFKASGHKDHVAKAVPGTNHLFQKCETGDPGEFFKQNEVFTPEVLNEIGDWIATHAVSAPWQSD